MANVFFFDLRDANTRNFERLQDNKYLLWDKKSKKMNISDYCIVYYQNENKLITTKVIQGNVYPEEEGDKWFVEYDGNKYYFESNGEYEEFVVFEKIRKYKTTVDFRISSQGGVTQLTQPNETEFKKNKLHKIVQIIEEKDILKILNKFTKDTIVDAIIKALSHFVEATVEEIYEYIVKKGIYNFGAEKPHDVIRIQLERHCKDSDWSRKATMNLFYKNDPKYGLIASLSLSSNHINLLEKKKQIILYGPPGTGKTYNTRIITLELLHNK